MTEMTMRELCKRLGDPAALHGATQQLSGLDATMPKARQWVALRVVDTLMDYIRGRAIIEVVSGEGEGIYRVDAYVVAMNRAEFERLLMGAYRAGKEDAFDEVVCDY